MMKVGLEFYKKTIFFRLRYAILEKKILSSERGTSQVNVSFLSWRERLELWFRLLLRIVIVAVVLLFLSIWLPRMLSAFMPFFLAFLFAWLVNLPMRFLNRKLGIPRKPMALLFMFILIAGIGLVVGKFAAVIGTEVVSFARNWSSHADALLRYFTMFEDWVSTVSPSMGIQLERLIDELFLWLQSWMQGLITNASLYAGAGNFIKQIPDFFVATIIFLMGSYFIACDFPAIRSAAADRLPENFRSFLSGIRSIVSSAFGGYVKAQLMLSAGVFVILLVGFLMTRQSYALLLAMGMALVDFIPILGAGTFMVPWAVFDLFTGKYQHAIGLMVIWGVIVLFRRVAEPKVLGDQTGLHPILSLLAIFLGMKMGGLLGMVLGPVLFLTVMNIVKAGGFHGLFVDVKAAVDDVYGLLKVRPSNAPPPPEKLE